MFKNTYPLFIIGGSASFGSRKAAFNAVLHVAFFCLSGNAQSSFPFPNKDDDFISGGFVCGYRKAFDFKMKKVALQCSLDFGGFFFICFHCPLFFKSLWDPLYVSHANAPVVSDRHSHDCRFPGSCIVPHVKSD
jgi:hypothetical protein